MPDKIINSAALIALQQNTDLKLLIADCGDPERYAQQHIHGALHVAYEYYTRSDAPVGGLVANEQQLSKLFSGIGLTPDTLVVAYDDAGNGKAARLLYTLDCIGHENWALLDGGLVAWEKDQGPLTAEISEVFPTHYTAKHHAGKMLTADQIAARLPNLKSLDARSSAEYTGAVAKSKHGGHIPGAVHIEWTTCMDTDNEKRLLPLEVLREMLAAHDLKPSDEIVCYCQTHHRSAYSYVMLKHLGYSNISGYPGAWSDWGNRNDLPIE